MAEKKRTKEEQIKINMELLDCSYEEALSLYIDDLEDNIGDGETLQEKAKKSGAEKIYVHDKTKKKTQKERVKKTAPDKSRIMQLLFSMLENDNDIFDIEVINEERQVSFHCGDDYYSFVLTKHTKKKK